MIKNVLEVIRKTTAMPFHWLKTSYRCFYCYDIFQVASELISHQSIHTDDSVKEKAMNNYWESTVYVDISNMKCKLCADQITDLYDMVDHIVAKHNSVYNKDGAMSMIAFRLNDFNLKCVICDASYYAFSQLLNHVNKDHKGTSEILCEVCGQGFKGQNDLRSHSQFAHDNSGIPCPECGDKFETKAKLNTHQVNSHGLERKYFKCLVCEQTFRSHYKRSRHMAEDHKRRQQFKCQYCPKTFIFQGLMMTHVKYTHLKIRDHICSVCGWKAFNGHRLKNHMYTHSGERNFKCDACDKSFTTPRMMKKHFVRMHKNNDSGTDGLVAHSNPYAGQ